MDPVTERHLRSLLQAPPLWDNPQKAPFALFDTSGLVTNIGATDNPDGKIIFGKYMEKLLSAAIQASSRYELLAENLQIKDAEERTVGEVDFLLYDHQTQRAIHLELACKFYLFDAGLASEDSYSGFIGPNRNDLLSDKIHKLRDKQFPLLYRPEAVSALKQLNLDSGDFEQQLYFPAQLYLPEGVKPEAFPLHNRNCFVGRHLTFNEWLQNANPQHSFISPSKKDWFSHPANHGTWQSFDQIQPFLQERIAKQKSCMLWEKQGNGTYSRYFVTWWDGER